MLEVVIVGLQQFVVGIRVYEIKIRDYDSYDTKMEFLQKPV
jgi:hypothetical protein